VKDPGRTSVQYMVGLLARWPDSVEEKPVTESDRDCHKRICNSQKVATSKVERVASSDLQLRQHVNNAGKSSLR
jgi:hypothetical protein